MVPIEGDGEHANAQRPSAFSDSQNALYGGVKVPH